MLTTLNKFDHLDDYDLNEEQSVKIVEKQLKNSVTIELLQMNRQSQQEKDLKLLSVISILIGVGIFTTLILACKRFYDSGGTSINFFKPLSQNLYETMKGVVDDLEDKPQFHG